MSLLKLISSTSQIYVLLIFLLLGADQLYSQAVYKPYYIQEKANAVSSAPYSTGTLHIVAARIEFQPDTTRFTSGNGTFSDSSIPYLQSDEVTIDPLPHNRAYFEAHLEFAKNYFTEMSDGDLNIEFNVLNEVYRLPEKMAAYSPIGENPGSEPLANLARDAWNEVAGSEDLGLDLNSGDRIAFVLFHAGVGRDIELTGTTLDKTPQDIPSVYISTEAFRDLFDDPSFSGFPIDDGNILVNNTLILPRTLSRAGEDVTGSEILLQLSINGMVTAQIGSHLGLPDLFNTQTGESGIGRFGLMDGAGIFAYNGLFPPELSAWEKAYMGWAEPFELEYDLESDIVLPAASLRRDDSIARVSISSREYFLVENRHRDLDGSGTTLTIRRPDGSLTTQTFTNTDTTFVYQLADFSDELEAGVVIDVSNYDFALPGGPADVLEETDQDDERILNGGFLIWHIDEGIIQRQLMAGEGINDDPLQRGVNLMEADGAQDIGRPTAIGFFENEVNGSPFDFWWSGNNASVITPTQTISLYENRFGPNTIPNNNSNSGAASNFALVSFSDNIPVASFNIERASASDLYRLVESTQNPDLTYATPVNNQYWANYPLSTLIYDDGRNSVVHLPASDGLSTYVIDDARLIQDYSGSQTLQQPLLDSQTGRLALAPNPALESNAFIVSLLDRDAGGSNQTGQFAPALNRGLISSPAADLIQLDGTPDRARFTSGILDSDFYETPGFRSEQVQGFESILANDGSLTIKTPSQTFSSSVLMPSTPFSRQHVGLFEEAEGSFKTYLILEGQIILIDTEQESGVRQRIIHDSARLDWPALVDINESGNIDFIFVDRASNQLIAKNQNGAVVSGFPIDAPAGTQFRGTPLISDLDGNSKPDIIISAQTSESLNLYAYSADGQALEGFPLLVGAYSVQNSEFVHPSMNDSYLAAVSPAGDFRLWEFPEAQDTQWQSRYGNDGNNKLTGRLEDNQAVQPDFTVLNRKETYNWPNPATDETFLRFQTSGPGEVKISITTTSGRLIYRETHTARGGSPEQIKIDTSSWGSGGYLALVEATVDGQTEQELVKIAVAR